MRRVIVAMGSTTPGFFSCFPAASSIFRLSGAGPDVRGNVDGNTNVNLPNIYETVNKANKLYEDRNYKEAITEYSKALALAKSLKLQNHDNEKNISIENFIDENVSTFPDDNNNVTIIPATDDTLYNNSDGEEIGADFLALLFSNRSASYYKLSQYENAETDAIVVIRLRPAWSKGYFRRAEALAGIKEFDNAIKFYEKALEKDPDNLEVRLGYARAAIAKDDNTMGLSVYQLLPGRDIALAKPLSPIQNKIFEFAVEMRNFIYLIVDLETRYCMVVDACWDIDGICRIMKRDRLKLAGCIVSHYHFDHVGGTPPPPYDQFYIKVSGLSTLLRRFPQAKAYVHAEDIPYLQENNQSISGSRLVPTYDGMEIELGQRTQLQFIHTPGHTPGSQCVLVNGVRLFTGDTLFLGACGRLDLPGGDMKRMYDSLMTKLRPLRNDVVVFPGHHYGGAWTTIGQEKDYGVLKHSSWADWLASRC